MNLTNSDEKSVAFFASCDICHESYFFAFVQNDAYVKLASSLPLGSSLRLTRFEAGASDDSLLANKTETNNRMSTCRRTNTLYLFGYTGLWDFEGNTMSKNAKIKESAKLSSPGQWRRVCARSTKSRSEYLDSRERNVRTFRT